MTGKEPGQVAYEAFASAASAAYATWEKVAPDHREWWAAVERAVRSTLPPTGRRFRHKIRGATYTLLGDALMQNTYAVATDKTECVVYRGDDGRMWVRPMLEFFDGRFEEVGQ